MAETERYFSNQECACGCENLLTTATANRGCKFIWGHKPKAAAALPKSARVKRASRPSAVVESGPVTLKAAMAFLLESKAELDRQFHEQYAIKVTAQAAVDAVMEKLRPIDELIAGLKRVCGEADHG